ncbi:unnamed protein product [Parnassius apollo]|uniref:(apollo) hypothetical protein n=1 Tax=Parnassius apollo TaxID=110799 RepID=A0A8S3WTK5_PARAO|nr:unnamed protein product [Parnassius apollo]
MSHFGTSTVMPIMEKAAHRGVGVSCGSTETSSKAPPLLQSGWKKPKRLARFGRERELVSSYDGAYMPRVDAQNQSSQAQGGVLVFGRNSQTFVRSACGVGTSTL